MIIINKWSEISNKKRLYEQNKGEKNTKARTINQDYQWGTVTKILSDGKRG